MSPFDDDAYCSIGRLRHIFTEIPAGVSLGFRIQVEESFSDSASCTGWVADDGSVRVVARAAFHTGGTVTGHSIDATAPASFAVELDASLRDIERHAPKTAPFASLDGTSLFVEVIRNGASTVERSILAEPDSRHRANRRVISTVVRLIEAATSRLPATDATTAARTVALRSLRSG